MHVKPVTRQEMQSQMACCILLFQVRFSAHVCAWGMLELIGVDVKGNVLIILMLPYFSVLTGSDAPRLIRGPENVIETVGSKAEFHCEFDSSQNVEVQWSFVNNGLILNSSR